MGNLTRFGVSIESDLLERFDQLITDRGYQNRSEALRDMIRDCLVQSQLEKYQDEIEVLGSLSLVYDHHARELNDKMAELQHQHYDIVISVLHAHISHDDCMEVIMLRGSYAQVHLLANSLLGLKGVKHGKLFVSVATQDITQDPTEKSSTHSHDHNHSDHDHNPSAHDHSHSDHDHSHSESHKHLE